MRRSGVPFGIVAGLLAFSSLACATTSRVATQPAITAPIPSATLPTATSAGPAEPSPTARPTPTSPAPTSSPEPILPDSTLNQTAGQLEQLGSYQASLHVAASGLQNGQAFNWDYAITQTVSAEPRLAVVAVDATGLGEGRDASRTLLIESGQRLLAHWSPDGDCLEGSPDLALGLFDALFGLLPDLGGAQNDKRDTLSGVPADHYVLAGSPSGVSGELWMAHEGGFLIQASLKQEGALVSLGSDATGTAAWEYRLTSINQPVEPVLPVSCRYLLGDFPLPDDAAGLAAGDDTISFASAKSPVDLAAFFADAMKNEGWEPVGQPDVSESAFQSAFARESNRALISGLRQGEVTYVTVLVSKVDPGTTDVTSTPASP